MSHLIMLWRELEIVLLWAYKQNIKRSVKGKQALRGKKQEQDQGEEGKGDNLGIKLM